MLDLIKKLLTWDPKQRLSAAEALKHPFFGNNDEPITKSIDIPSFDFEFEKYDLPIEIIKELIVDEITMYHSKEAREEYRKLRKVCPKGVLEKIYAKEQEQDEAEADTKSTASYKMAVTA